MNTSTQKPRAVIVHGWEGSPDGNWFPWAKGELEARGYSVCVPAMPSPGLPKNEEWLETLRGVLEEPDDEAVLIGHSLGCATVIRYAAGLPDHVRLRALVLVSGFVRPLGNPATDGFFVEPFDFEAAKWQSGRIISIHSNNDPYIAPKEFKFLKEALDAEELVMPGAGHINADSGYVRLDELLDFI